MWKLRLWKCEFCENWDFGNVNFVKIEILEMWILSKMRHRKCEFRGKWDFGNVNFVENETLKLWISWKMRLFWWLFNYCVIIFHATNLCRRTIRCLGHIHKFWSSNFSSRENAKVNKLCPTAKQGRSPAKLDFHFLLTLPRQIKPIGAAAQTTLEFLQKKVDGILLLCPSSTPPWNYFFFVLPKMKLLFFSRARRPDSRLQFSKAWVEFHVFQNRNW